MKMFRLLCLVAVMLVLAAATIEEAHGDDIPEPRALGIRLDWQQHWLPAMIALMSLVNTHGLYPLMRALMRQKAAEVYSNNELQVRVKKALGSGRPLMVKRGEDGRFYIRMINPEEGEQNA